MKYLDVLASTSSHRMRRYNGDSHLTIMVTLLLLSTFIQIAQIRQQNEKAGEASLNTQIETWARNTARVSRSGAEEETPATTQLAKFLTYIGWTVR